MVFRNELIELLQFSPVTEEVHETPLLIFPPWINKYYILDLREENSMIRWLTEQGHTVFVVSWRSGEDEIKDFDWDDYVMRGFYPALSEVLEICKTKQANLVGYCIGGTMASSAIAHMAKKNDKRVASVTYFASQADFAEAGDLLVFTDDTAISHIETLIADNGGLMAGEDMAETFNYLRPVDLVWRYVVDNYMLGKKPRAFDLLYWNGDQTNIPGPTHLTYLKDLYRDNALSEGNFTVAGERVELGAIEVPSFFQASRDDHIAPFRSIYRAACKFGGKPKFVLSGSGHIAGVINHPSAMKYQHWTNESLPSSPDDWLKGAEETPGSWWPCWGEWLKARSGPLVPARKVKGKHLGDAQEATSRNVWKILV